MSTRFILHGGNADNGGEKNARFFADILKGVNRDTVRVLCIYFARPEERWEDAYATDQSSFNARAIEIGKIVDTVLATYDIEDLIDEITMADVIFINGGYRGHLKDTLLAIGTERIRRLVEGKTVVGISAGANMLTKYYYSMASGGIREGIGILNIKLLTHSNVAEAAGRLSLLKSYKEDLPILTVKEEEYITL